MILVDSSVWIGFFNGLETRQTDLILTEVLRKRASHPTLTVVHADFAV
jgi:hypothetical protein